MHLWNRLEVFPIKFIPYDCFEHKTDACVEQLNQSTDKVKKFFEALKDEKAPGEIIESSIKSFVVEVGPRGVMTMLGMRCTVSSQEIPWPNMEQLMDSFNTL